VPRTLFGKFVPEKAKIRYVTNEGPTALTPYLELMNAHFKNLRESGAKIFNKFRAANFFVFGWLIF
jgi:hypothetical protein